MDRREMKGMQMAQLGRISETPKGWIVLLKVERARIWFTMKVKIQSVTVQTANLEEWM